MKAEAVSMTVRDGQEGAEARSIAPPNDEGTVGVTVDFGKGGPAFHVRLSVETMEVAPGFASIRPKGVQAGAIAAALETSLRILTTGS